jgi:uncharacterized protein YcbK (DUF882 family)
MRIFEISLLLALFMGIFFPSYADFEPEEVFSQAGDGVITLFNTHTGEIETIRYKEHGGHYLNSGVEKVNGILRCRLTGERTAMSLKLIELLDHIEDHFKASRVEIVSGYRSPALNSALRRAGRGVARNSLHMEGLATDIRLPGVPLLELRNFARSLHAGGVGYYPGNFVHIDTGKVRYW